MWRAGLIHFTAIVFFDLFVIFYTTASNLILSGPDDNKNGITDDELKILNTIILTLHVCTTNMSLGRRDYWPLGKVENVKCHRI